MKNIKNTSSGSQRRKALRAGPVILAAIATLLSGVGSASASPDLSVASKGNQPLVTSQLYIADASYCSYTTWFNYDLPYSQPPCNQVDGADEFFGSSVWSISVTNPNRSAEARNVRARVVLLDASGNEIMNKVMQVAARIPPGQTTWLAPSGRLSGFFTTDPSEGQGVVASGTVTILPHSWARGSKLRTIRVPMTFAASASSSRKRPGLFFYEPTATFSNSGAAFKGYFTVILLGDSGTPIGGLRLNDGKLTEIRRGTNYVEFDFDIPGTLSTRIADMQLFVSR